MKIAMLFDGNEVASIDCLCKQMVRKDLMTNEEAKQLCCHNDVHEAHNGFVVMGENNSYGDYKVTIVIPEWVTVESLDVIEQNLDQVVAVVAAIKAAAAATKVLLKNLSDGFKKMWKDHNMPGEF